MPESEGNVLHSARAAPVVAVVEVETFALEDECAETILGESMVSVLGGFGGVRRRVECRRHRDILWRLRWFE